MEFANNWDLSPFPDYMYEPVLKLQMRLFGGQGPDRAMDDAGFILRYDPEIVAGQYTRPKTPEERKDLAEFFEGFKPPNRKSDAEIQAILDKPYPFESPKAINLIFGGTHFHTFAATQTTIGKIMRVKVYGHFGDQKTKPADLLRSYSYAFDEIKKRQLPLISQYPEDFLLYVYRNFVRMPALLNNEYEGRRFPDVTRVEICLHSLVMTRVFKLRLQDFPEVEPNWHCLASTEVNT